MSENFKKIPRTFFRLRRADTDKQRETVIKDILWAYKAKHRTDTLFDALYDIVLWYQANAKSPK